MLNKKIICSFSNEEAILKIGKKTFLYKDECFNVKKGKKIELSIDKESLEARMSKSSKGILWSPEEYLIAGLGIFMFEEMKEKMIE